MYSVSMKNIHLVLILIVLALAVSCKSTAEPVVYDENVDRIDEECQIIHLLINNKNYKEASFRIEKNLQLYPNNIDILLLKAWLLLQEKEYSQSEELLLAILEKNKKNPLALAGLGRIYRLNGDFEKAKSYIELGIGLQSNQSIFWFEMGIIDFESKEYKKAILNFTKAVSLEKNNYDALFFRYICYLKEEKDVDKRKQIWENLVKANMMKSWYYLYHANTLYEIGNKDDAFFILNEGLGKFPGDIYLLNYHAYLLIEKYKKENKTEDLQKAEEYSKQCLKSEINPEFLDTYFMILELNGKLGELKQELNRYLLEYPESKILLKWLKKIAP